MQSMYCTTTVAFLKVPLRFLVLILFKISAGDEILSEIELESYIFFMLQIIGSKCAVMRIIMGL